MKRVLYIYIIKRGLSVKEYITAWAGKVKCKNVRRKEETGVNYNPVVRKGVVWSSKHEASCM